MLEEWDVDFIRSNRDEVTRNREVTIVAHGTALTGVDPITGEPVYASQELGEYRVTWDIPNTKRQEQLMEMGYEMEASDRVVKFRYDVDVAAIERIEYKERLYRFITKDPRGIGEEPNRFEAVVRLVT